LYEKPPLVVVAAALEQIDQWSDLTPTQRDDLASALKTAARIAGFPTSNMPLTPAALRPRVLTASGAECGVSPARIRNIRSLLANVLRRLDVVDAEDTPVAAEWDIWLDYLSPEQRRGLIRFARFCTARGVTPAEVPSEMLQAFLGHIAERTLVRDPRKLVARIRRIWNQACARIAGWPGRPFAPLTSRRPLIRPLTAFSDSFQADVVAFGARLTATMSDPRDDDLTEPKLDDEATQALINLKPVRDSTANLRMSHVRWAANALVDSGTPINAVTSLRDLVTPLHHPKAILRHLYLAAGKQPSARGMHVAEALLMIAKYNARLADPDIERIREWGKKLTLVYVGMTEKNQARIRQALDPAREQKLAVLPETLMQIARDLRLKNPRLACARAMTAAAIKLFARRMLRLENVCRLRIDHLQQADPKRSLVTHVSIPAANSKTRRAISLPIAPDIARLLEDWITNFRPIVAAPDCPYVFPGYRNGTRSVTPQGMSLAVKKLPRVLLASHYRHTNSAISRRTSF
jgi:hypothetical protein